MKLAIASTAVLVTLGLTGCGGDGPSESADPDFLDDVTPTAVVKGRLLQVDSNGNNPKAVAGSVILTGKNGATVADEVGQDGTFEVRVMPGDYQVGGSAPQPDGGTASCAAKAPSTTVGADAPTVVDVYCFVQGPAASN